jgi:hypothetical protein
MSSLRAAMNQVEEFHLKNKFPVRSVKLTPACPHGGQVLEDVTAYINLASERLLDVATKEGCQPSLRGHLCSEEPSELYVALAQGNELEVLDGLADSIYVFLGTAIVFDLPLEEAFEEVQRSNMTKERVASDPHAGRVRNKGPHYIAPDLKTILERHRDRAVDDSARPTVLEALSAVAAGMTKAEKKSYPGYSILDVLKKQPNSSAVDLAIEMLINVSDVEGEFIATPNPYHGAWLAACSNLAKQHLGLPGHPKDGYTPRATVNPGTMPGPGKD